MEACNRSLEIARTRMMSGDEKIDRSSAMSVFNLQGAEIAKAEYLLKKKLEITQGYEELLVYCNREWGENLTL